MTQSSASTATTYMNKPAVKASIGGYAGQRPEKPNRRSLRRAPSSANPSIAAETSTATVTANSSYDAERLIADLRSALRQAVMELREASNILTDKDMPSTAKVFAVAAERKAKLLEAAHV